LYKLYGTVEVFPMNAADRYTLQFTTNTVVCKIFGEMSKESCDQIWEYVFGMFGN